VERPARYPPIQGKQQIKNGTQREGCDMRTFSSEPAGYREENDDYKERDGEKAAGADERERVSRGNA